MNKKGFISTSIIYSFFLVFILLMIAFLMSFVNKRFLISKISDSKELDPDVLECTKGKSLRECLFKSEYIEYIDSEDESDFKNNNVELENAKFTEDSITEKIRAKGTPDFSMPSETEEGMYAAEDNYGTSYYYRGAEDDNYVVFDDFVWRIIRVNGDGSIRMIYQGNYNALAGEESSKVLGDDYIGESLFNRSSFSDDYGAVDIYRQGYMYSDKTGTVKKINKYINVDSSKVKLIVDSWFSTNNINNDYLANVIFCGDKNVLNDEELSLAEDWDEYYNVLNGFFSKHNFSVFTYNQYYFGAVGRLIYTDEYSPTPTFICRYTGLFVNNENTAKYNLSSYTTNNNGFSLEPMTAENYQNLTGLDKEKILGYCNMASLPCKSGGNDKNNYSKENLYLSHLIKLEEKFSPTLLKLKEVGNGALSHNAALISADEVAMAGAVLGKENTSFYLHSDDRYWTMSLAYVDKNPWNDKSSENFDAFAEGYDVTISNKGAYYFTVANNGALKMTNTRNGSYKSKVRPVINLKSDILYCDGSGSASNPYIIGNGSC